MRGLLAVLALVAPLSAHAWAGSVKVRVARLEGVPADLARSPLAVRTCIGDKVLYTTPFVSGSAPVWGKSLRAWTASGRSIVFEVLREGRIDERRPDSNSDDALAAGFEDLVDDYDTGPAQAPRRSSRGGSRFPVVVCRAALAWPPTDGEHALDCNGMVLRVTTTRLAR